LRANDANSGVRSSRLSAQVLENNNFRVAAQDLLGASSGPFGILALPRQKRTGDNGVGYHHFKLPPAFQTLHRLISRGPKSAAGLYMDNLFLLAVAQETCAWLITDFLLTDVGLVAIGLSLRASHLATEFVRTDATKRTDACDKERKPGRPKIRLRGVRLGRLLLIQLNLSQF
jgi:hypothetical protein